MAEPLLRIDLPGVPLFRRGKVRDTFDLGDQLLMVSSDRVSAFDGIVRNHLLATDPADFPPELARYADLLRGRSVLVRKAERIDIECVVRGYLSGTAWVEYQRDGTVCGQSLPPGLTESVRLSEPIFTPAMKNDEGHDENIPIARMVELVGAPLAAELERLTRAVYAEAVEYAAARGIIIADTKLEFGLLDGVPILIDELLTPDSSRFWEADRWEPGRPQDSLDKQPLRDWLLSTGWNREPPAPTLPPEVVERMAAKYRAAHERLTGRALPL
jgi:phosphoribosylaminoimidazole-succinocarboxamide synthase